MMPGTVFSLALAALALFAVASAADEQCSSTRNLQLRHMGWDSHGKKVYEPYVSPSEKVKIWHEHRGRVGRDIHHHANRLRRFEEDSDPVPFPEAEKTPVPYAENPIGIISAFAPEAQLIVASMEEGSVSFMDKGGRRFFEGVLYGKEVVVVVCGIGMVNAAMTTQMLVDYYNVSMIFFSGIGGGVNPQYQVGDVLIPRKWAEYLYSKMIRVDPSTSGFVDGAPNFPNLIYTDPCGRQPSLMRPSCMNCNDTKPGELPYFSIPMMTETFTNGEDAYEAIPPQQFWFPVDPILLGYAKEAIAKGIPLVNSGVNPITNETFTFPYTPTCEITKAGVADSVYVDNAEFREQVFYWYEADILDMESPAVLKTCKSNGVRCLVIRSVSDLAGEQGDPNATLTFVGFAAQNSGIVLKAIMEQIPDGGLPEPEPSPMPTEMETPEMEPMETPEMDETATPDMTMTM